MMLSILVGTGLLIIVSGTAPVPPKKDKNLNKRNGKTCKKKNDYRDDQESENREIKKNKEKDKK